MKIAPLPFNEELRLKELNSYNILDSKIEKEYDDLVELASQICECPIALITFVDEKRQWFKARKNVIDKETSRDLAFCAHTILQDDVMTVKDARNDLRFHDNELVTGKLQIGFYAGTPIYSSSGYKLGSVCVIDHVKKDQLTANQNNALKIIAGQVAKLLELRAKNKLIIKKSNEKIKAEKEFSQSTIESIDSKDNSIAYELHENLGQTLSAIKLFIESAENSKENQATYLKKSKDTITQLIGEVNSLSKSLSPTTFKNINYYWIIEDYAKSFGKEHHINISFGKSIEIKNTNSDFGLNLFRIVQNLFEIAKYHDPNSIFIDIKSSPEICINFNFNFKNDIKDNSLNTQLNNVVSRVELLKGSISRDKDNNQQSFIIKLPKTSKSIKVISS
jgi:hypothetical protein